MKKLLLSLIALCGFTAMQADEITEELTVDNFELTKATTYTNVTYTSKVTEITYSGNMCKASDTNGSGMQFRTTSDKEAGLVATQNPQGLKIKSVTVEPSTSAPTTNQWDVYGSATAYSTFKDLYDTATAGTLIGSGTTENTVTAKVPLDFFGFRGHKNAIYIQKITIVYETAGTATKDAAGLKFSQNQFVVCLGDEFVAPTLTKATTAPAVYSSSDESVATVEEETGIVNILAAGSTTITATTAETDEFYAGEASYTITVIEANKTVNSIAEAMAVTDKTENLIVGFPLTVAFKNYNNTFATDGKDFIQVYGAGQPDYAVGDVIPAGWVANYTLYNDVTPEFLIVSGFGPQEATQHVEFTPAYVTEITNADVNKVVALRGVEFTEDTPSTKTNFDGVFNGQTLSFRNNYAIEGVAAGKYDVTVVVTLYKAKDATEYTPSLYVVNYSQDTTGIESVEAEDANAPVEFFNLQGVRVANPENGLFIRRQGNKVEKVVIR